MTLVGAEAVRSIRSVTGNNNRDLIKEVLEKGYLMSLATEDDGGVWVSDVIYIYDEKFNI